MPRVTQITLLESNDAQNDVISSTIVSIEVLFVLSSFGFCERVFPQIIFVEMRINQESVRSCTKKGEIFEAILKLSYSWIEL